MTQITDNFLVLVSVLLCLLEDPFAPRGSPSVGVDKGAIHHFKLMIEKFRFTARILRDLFIHHCQNHLAGSV